MLGVNQNGSSSLSVEEGSRQRKAKLVHATKLSKLQLKHANLSDNKATVFSCTSLCFNTFPLFCELFYTSNQQQTEVEPDKLGLQTLRNQQTHCQLLVLPRLLHQHRDGLHPRSLPLSRLFVTLLTLHKVTVATAVIGV